MSNPIRRSARPVSDGDLAMLEHDLELTLPAAYRAFLLSSNGGVPRRTKFTHQNKDGKRRETWLGHFYPTTREGLIDLDWLDLPAANQNRPEGLPKGMIFVADAQFHGNVGKVCVGTQGEQAGKIYFRPEVEGKKSTLYFVADSWDAFLDGMTFDEKSERPWRDPIEAGDVEGFRAWLDKHNRKLEDGSLRIDVERAVIAENSYPMVLLLIEHGIEAADFFEEAMDAQRYDLARELLHKQDVSGERFQKCLLDDSVFLWYLTPFLEELVAKGADVNAEDDSGETPLHKAVTARSEEGVRFLLGKGADPTAKNDDGRTPRKLARRLEETRLMEILKGGEEAWAKRPKPAEPELVDFDLRGVHFEHVGPQLTLDDIRKFEEEIKLPFTPEYRGLLLKLNGGVPKPGTVAIDLDYGDDDEDEDDEGDEEGHGEEGDEQEGFEPILEFFPLRREHARKVTIKEEPDQEFDSNTVEDAREFYHDGMEIPRGMIPVGSLDNHRGDSILLLLVCKGKDKGKLHAIDFNMGRWPLNIDLNDLFELLKQSKERPKSVGEKLADAVDARDPEGMRAAIAEGAVDVWACRDGRMPVRKCVETGFDEGVLVMADGGWKLGQLLSEAASFDRQKLFNELAARLKKLSKEEAKELLCYPMTYANADLLKKIVDKGVKLGKMGKYEQSNLIPAVQSGSVEGVKTVLAAGADLNYATEEGETALHFAAGGTGDSLDMVHFLLERGLKPNQVSTRGYTPLHHAVEAGNLELAKKFMDLGGDLYAKHELRPAGMSAEKAAKEAKKVAKLLGNMGKMFGDLDLDEDDAPPPPDTSEPAGEKAAELLETLEQAKQQIGEKMGGLMGQMEEKLAERMSGSWGKGPSALEVAKQSPDGQKIVAELEAYAAAKPLVRG